MEKNRNVSDEREREQNPLRPDQLTPGGRARTAASRRAPTTVIRRRHPASAASCSPSELGYKGSLFGTMFGGNKKEEPAKFTGEPPRTSLDRAAARLPDAVAGSALRPRQGERRRRPYNDYYTTRADPSE